MDFIKAGIEGIYLFCLMILGAFGTDDVTDE